MCAKPAVLALGDDAPNVDGELAVLELVLPPPADELETPPPAPPPPRSTADPVLAPLGLLRAPLPASPPALGLCANAGVAASVNPASTMPSLKLRTLMSALHAGDLAVRRMILQQICHMIPTKFTGGRVSLALPYVPSGVHSVPKAGHPVHSPDRLGFWPTTPCFTPPPSSPSATTASPSWPATDR